MWSRSECRPRRTLAKRWRLRPGAMSCAGTVTLRGLPSRGVGGSRVCGARRIGRGRPVRRAPGVSRRGIRSRRPVRSGWRPGRAAKRGSRGCRQPRSSWRRSVRSRRQRLRICKSVGKRADLGERQVIGGRRQARRHRRAGWGSAIRVFTDSLAFGANAATYTGAVTLLWLPVSVITAPPYEWPTGVTGPGGAWITGRVTTTPSFGDSVGFCATATAYPSREVRALADVSSGAEREEVLAMCAACCGFAHAAVCADHPVGRRHFTRRTGSGTRPPAWVPTRARDVRGSCRFPRPESTGRPRAPRFGTPGTVGRSLPVRSCGVCADGAGCRAARDRRCRDVVRAGW
ncbi:hypothetical protein EHYA_05519 [Embleya hyalina]|uniref:Uncharacterized protein n=1 Tax=Embleya hyalina TaxID=516124 RepID=A0A401YTB8_9ACTN|nr:hypothetical protein EHYA_05519 [Embleya hyalina]